MQMKCAGCGGRIAGEDIDEVRALATCSFCGSAYSLSGRTLEDGGTAREVPAVERAEVPLPRRMKMEENAGVVRISWNWRTLANVGVPLLVLAGLVAFVGGALLPSGPREATGIGTRIGVLAYVTAFPLYVCLAMLLNRTVITAGRSVLEVRHGPLPWRWSRRLDSAGVRQIYCVRLVRDDLWELHAEMASSATHRLAADLQTMDQALYLSQRLGRALGLERSPGRGDPRG